MSTIKFNKTQHGRAVYVWIVKNLISELAARGVDVSMNDPLKENDVISGRQCFIKTMLACPQVVPMETQGIETYFRNIGKEFDPSDKAEPKVVLPAEVDAVADSVLDTIENALGEYEVKLELKAEKDAEKADKKAANEQKIADRKAASAKKEADKELRKEERLVKQAERKAEKEAATEAKAAEKEKAKELQAELLAGTMGMMNGTTGQVVDSDIPVNNIDEDDVDVYDEDLDD